MFDETSEKFRKSLEAQQSSSFSIFLSKTFFIGTFLSNKLIFDQTSPNKNLMGLDRISLNE
jgi:hypothetical protein